MNRQGAVKRILVVDDERAILVLLKTFLEGEGYEVRGAESGKSVDQILEEFEPELIITDIMMPSEDGFSVVSRIREQRPSIKILYLSAWIDESDTEQMLCKELVNYPNYKILKKPFALDDILRIIRE